jgi:repressor LexA
MPVAASVGTEIGLGGVVHGDHSLVWLDSRRACGGSQAGARGCISVGVETLGFKPTPRTYALEVRGDSMIGKCIMDGDMVVLEHGTTPRNGDVVAALIDNESTLKTFVMEKGRAFLRAENPRYPNLIPANELVIQGVMVALVRKRKG